MRGTETGRRFFVKLHRASTLHFDFRLEHDGVLKSWVIPDGPCLDPTEHRLATLVDNHKLKYGSVERVIPPGYYGAGPVLLWDRGIWQPVRGVDQALDVDRALADGRLEFHLEGEKLKGVWSLNRIPVRSGVRGRNWLLIKEQDAEAQSLSEMDIVAQMPLSVLTNRTLGEVAADPRRVVSEKSSSSRTTRSKKNRPDRRQLSLSFDDP